jgi:hypothetical protein
MQGVPESEMPQGAPWSRPPQIVEDPHRRPATVRPIYIEQPASSARREKHQMSLDAKGKVPIRPFSSVREESALDEGYRGRRRSPR